MFQTVLVSFVYTHIFRVHHMSYDMYQLSWIELFGAKKSLTKRVSKKESENGARRMIGLFFSCYWKRFHNDTTLKHMEHSDMKISCDDNPKKIPQRDIHICTMVCHYDKREPNASFVFVFVEYIESMTRRIFIHVLFPRLRLLHVIVRVRAISYSVFLLQVQGCLPHSMCGKNSSSS